MKTLITLVAAAGFAMVAVAPALAQFYDRPNFDRPNYDRPNFDHPNYDRPNYDGPRGYDPRPHDRPEYDRARFGGRCQAVMRTSAGPQQLFCRIVQPKPLGADCSCPTPPGYGRRYVPGRTIR